jgi:hypothetical protein
MEKSTLKCHVLVGLPGSGKSTFANKQFEEAYKEFRANNFSGWRHINKWILDIDAIMLAPKGSVKHSLTMPNTGEVNMKKVFRESTNLDTTEDAEVWLDGLYLTNDDVIKVLKDLQEVGHHFNMKVDVVIDQWEEDREKCLINDSLRHWHQERDLQSKSIIKGGDYEVIDISAIEKMIVDGELDINDVSYVSHEIVTPEEWQITLGLPGTPEEAKTLVSSEWCTGGTWASYNGEGELSAESPKDNDKLIDILEKVAPDIKMRDYVEVMRTCAKIVDTTEYDYYGGCGHYSHWETDTEKLYETLKKMGYIKTKHK